MCVTPGCARRLVVPLGLADVSQFGDGSRELFVKSSCYSVVAIAVDNPGPTIKWVFSSEPKSISFSVVYRDTADSQVEQSKVGSHSRPGSTPRGGSTRVGSPQTRVDSKGGLWGAMPPRWNAVPPQKIILFKYK